MSLDVVSVFETVVRFDEHFSRSHNTRNVQSASDEGGQFLPRHNRAHLYEHPQALCICLSMLAMV